MEAQQENYRASGFVYAGGTTRFTGQLAGKRFEEIRYAEPDDKLRLIEMEGYASGVVKPDYLQAWFSNVDTRSTLILDNGQQIIGFVTIRSCQEGAKIGPLVADDTDIAHTLISHAASLFDGPLTIDVPETATGLTQLCEQLGLEPGFRTARMYRGQIITSQPDVFAVTSLELG